MTGKGYSRSEFDLTGHGEKLSDLVPVIPAYQPADVSFDLAVRGKTDWTIVAVDRLKARLGDARFELSGELQVQPTLAAKGIRLAGSGPRLSELGTIREWKLTDRPFKITASVQSSAGEQLVDDLRFESGKNNLNGRFRYTRGSNVPSVEIALKSSHLNLDEIRVPQLAEDESVAAATSQDRVFTNDPLPFEVLDTFDAELSVEIDDLHLNQRRWRNLVAEASLKQGVLEVRRAQADAAEGKLNASGIVKPAPTGRSIAAEITATHAMIALSDMTPEEIEQLPHYAIAAQLSALGSTTRELATSLDGFAWIIGGRGQIRRSNLGPLAGDFLTELLGAINPLSWRKKKYAQIDCQGLYFEIANGRIETAPAIVLQAEHAVVLATGTIDLESEKIDFIFETTQRKGIGVSLSDYTNLFTKIGGTLGNPKVILDPKVTLVEGGAAVATGGLSVLVKGILKRWLGAKRICKKVADEAVKIRSKRDPDTVPDLDQLMAGTQKPGTG